MHRGSAAPIMPALSAPAVDALFRDRTCVFAQKSCRFMKRTAKPKEKKMFNRHPRTEAPPRTLEDETPNVEFHNIVDDAQRLLELQESVKDAYQEMGQIKKRIRSAKNPLAGAVRDLHQPRFAADAPDCDR
jgi:hypothetical protein